MKLNRSAKTQTYDQLESDMEHVQKVVERKLNLLAESNHAIVSSRAIRHHGRRSSEVSSGGSQNLQRDKLGNNPSQIKLKDNYTSSYQQTCALPTFVQTPRRNGLTPRNYFEDEDEDDEMKLSRTMHSAMQEEYEQPLGTNNQLSQHSNHQMKKPKYCCSSCGAEFHIKSLLGAHRRTHDDDFKVRFRSRRSRESTTALASVPPGKQCKFCDRIFVLERALRIHQLCHCNKITPQQRRKLGYTDLAHEKKNAPLPNFQRIVNTHSLPLRTVADPNMPYVALGPAALKMIEQEQQQQKAKRHITKYTVKVAGPMGRWR